MALTWSRYPDPDPGLRPMSTYRASEEHAAHLSIEKLGTATAPWVVYQRGDESRMEFLGPDVPTLRQAKLLAEYIALGGDPNLHLPRVTSRRHPQTIRMRGGSASTVQWGCSCGERQSGGADGWRDAFEDGFWHAEQAWAKFIEEHGS